MYNCRIESKKDLYDKLNIDEMHISLILDDKENAYTRMKIPKKNGDRIIYAIKHSSLLYKVQKNLLNKIFKDIYFPNTVFGFLKHKSYFDFLDPHIMNSQSRYYLRLDIMDFFDSIRIEDVEKSLSYYINSELERSEFNQVLNFLKEIVSLNNKIVQGSVTAPAISNLVFRSLDIRIERYCEKFDITYTRYADDLFFSSHSSYVHTVRFINAIKTIISDKGFKLNYSKTLKYADEISIGGYVVSDNIRLSRKKYLELNKLLFSLESNTFKGFKTQKQKYICRNKLAGYRSFLIQTVRYVDDINKKAKINSKINKIEKYIDKYCNI